MQNATLRKKNSKKEGSFSQSMPTFLEFFAGSGLVAEGVGPFFKAMWANDLCPKKAAVYTANHGNENFHLGDINDINGNQLPSVTLSWASFPCQDLSLAGLTAGINAQRSGLVWQWLRIQDEMKRRPPILVAENVTGLLSVKNGEYYRLLHRAISDRGYKVGALVLDAAHWVPQSRKRVFVVAVKKNINLEGLVDDGPKWAHSTSLINAAQGLVDFTWWKLPEPVQRTTQLADLIDWKAPTDNDQTAKGKIHLVPKRHLERLMTGNYKVAPGYKRTRNGKQVLELRFDGVAGCLRTAEGGSSRQVVVLKTKNGVATRLLTVREAARLMGAPDSYQVPGSYNDGYTAMGDAVAVPVSHYLAKHLLNEIASRVKTANAE